MTKRSTKHSLIMSALSLLLCASMLIGTTFAWFTDSVTSTGNKIQSGTLVLDLEMYDEANTTADGYASIKDSNEPIFNYDKWEPGYTAVRLLKVENEGTLALKWYAKFISQTSVNDLANIADVIDVFVCPSKTVLSMPDRNLTGYTNVGTLRTFLNTIETSTHGTLNPMGEEGDEAYLGIALKMQESANNDYQNKTIEAFDIQILATQLEYEADSFDKTYDKPAEYPDSVVVEKVDDTSTVNTLDTGDFVTLDIPVGAPTGEYVLEMNNKKVETDPVTNETTVSMDLSLTRDGVKVSSADGVMYTVNLDIGTGKRVLGLDHNGVAVTDFDYNKTTGIITFETSHFSPFAITYDEVRVVTGLSGTGAEDDPYLINDYWDLCWFRDHVDTCAADGSSQYNGKFIKLTADINLNNENWEPIGSTTKDHGSFYGTFDGDGHTISNLYVNNTNSDEAAGFFGKVSGGGDGPRAVIKNLVFENVDVYTSGSYSGGIIGNAGGNSEIRNVKLIGDVKVTGYGYVGGMVGHGYPDMYNCHVDANDGSKITCNYWCGGGMIGYGGEGGTYLDDCSVKNISVFTQYGAAGAIVGLLQSNNTVKNLYAENVSITSASSYACGYACGNGEESTYENVSVKNVTAKINGTELSDIERDESGYHNTDNKDLIVIK